MTDVHIVSEISGLSFLSLLLFFNLVVLVLFLSSSSSSFFFFFVWLLLSSKEILTGRRYVQLVAIRH